MVPDLVSVGSEAEVRERVLAGEGLGLLLAHVVREDLRREALVRLPVAGTPVPGLWCATTLGRGRAVPGARALQRFVTTPDATAASVAPVGAPRAARALPPVHVTLWS
jgi:DNA-binding transcriptional LysR family regulator